MAPARPEAIERKRGSAGVKDRTRIRKQFSDICQSCKRPGRIVDHIIPLWDGGTNADSNLQTLCKTCHDAKSEREAGQRARG
ncbi:MAG: HNH endonuclease [Janthinobacterium lividum]